MSSKTYMTYNVLLNGEVEEGVAASSAREAYEFQRRFYTAMTQYASGNGNQFRAMLSTGHRLCQEALDVVNAEEGVVDAAPVEIIVDPCRTPLEGMLCSLGK